MNLFFSTTFPAYHPRAGESTGFTENILSRVKTHTIRLNYSWWWYFDGIVTFLCVWEGRPYWSKMRRFATAKIRVERIDEITEGVVHFGKSETQSQRLMSVEKFIQKDGLSESDFNGWFPKLESLTGCTCISFDWVQPYLDIPNEFPKSK